MQITEQTGSIFLGLATTKLLLKNPLDRLYLERMNSIEALREWEFNYLPRRAALAAKAGMEEILEEAMLDLRIKLLHYDQVVGRKL